MPSPAQNKFPALRQYSAITVRWLWFLGLSVVIAAVGAYVVSKETRPVYRATTLLIVDQQAPGQDTYTGLLASTQLIATYKVLLTEPLVLQKAADQVGGISEGQLQSHVQVTDQAGTQLINLQVDDTDPVRAARLANAIAGAFEQVQQQAATANYVSAQQVFSQQISQTSAQITSLTDQINALQAKDPFNQQIPALQQQLNSAQKNFEALQTLYAQLPAQQASVATSTHIFQPATPPTSPDHPRPLRYALVAGALGLVLAGCLVFLIELFGNRLHTSEQIEELMGVPVLAAIRAQKGANMLLSAPEASRNMRLAASFRALESNLSFIELERPLHTVVVTGAAPGEGKTMTAVNLAISLAQSGKRVLLVDADMRNPQIHNLLGIPNSNGLSQWLAHRSAPTFVSVFPDLPNLYVMPAGPCPPNPSQLLGTEQMQQMFKWSIGDPPGSGNVDMVIVDTPPLGTCVDAALVAGVADGTLLVVDGSRLRAGPILRVRDTLLRANATIIGIVLNRAERRQAVQQENYAYSQYHTLRTRSSETADAHVPVGMGQAGAEGSPTAKPPAG